MDIATRYMAGIGRFGRKGMAIVSLMLALPCMRASAVDLDVQAEVAQGLGSDPFDANKTTKYTVDITNGNLYVKQTDLIIPSQRGPSIEVSRTYNSRSFDFPRVLGTANWSFSLRKYLNNQGFVVITDPGNFEELKEGDVLEEAPESDNDCDELQILYDELEAEYSSNEDELFNIRDRIGDLSNDLSGLYDELDYWEETFNDYNDLLSDWEDLWDQPNYERDGPGNWMPEDDWQYYNFLGGNDGFAFYNELEEAQLNYEEVVPDEISYAEQTIAELENQEQELEDRQDELDDEIYEIYEALIDCENEVGYEKVEGFTFNDGDGEGCFIRSDAVAADQNAYHIAINNDDPDCPTAKLKDGTFYEFCQDGGVGVGRLVNRIQDKYGNALDFGYTNGKLTSVTDSSNHRGITIDYQTLETGDSAIYTITDHTGRTVTYHYDSLGRLDQVTYPDNSAIHYSYQENEALLIRIEDANTHGINFQYDYAARSPASNPWGRGIRQALSHCTRVWRDQTINGKYVGDTNYSYNFDPTSDPDTGTVTITDSRGFITKKTFQTFISNDSESGWAESKRKLVTEIADPYGKITRYSWDAGHDFQKLGNLVATEDTNGLRHEMIYDERGNLVQKTEDPGQEPAHRHYVSTWEYEPTYNQVIKFYDARANQEEEPYLTKQNYYIGDGQGGGALHGPDGVLWKEKDAEEHVTEHWYNQYGQKIKTIDADNNETYYEYYETQDALWGNLKRVIKKSPSSNTYAHNITNIYGYPGLTVWGFESIYNYSYGSWGTLKKERDFNNNLTEYLYDPMDRLQAKTVHDGTDSYCTRYEYDKVGNKKKMTDPRRVFSTYYDYDASDRLTAVREPEGRTTSYGYDTEGNKISETDANGNTTGFDYDALNRLYLKREPLNKITRYEYDGTGDSSTDGGSREYTRKKDRYTKMLQYRENEDQTGFTWISTSYNYDKLYRLESITNDKGYKTEYEYDPVGNKTAEKDTKDGHERRTDFAYFKTNLLQTITYPPAYDQAPRWTAEYEYNGMGNKTGEKDRNGQWTHFLYEDRNLLTTIQDAENDPARYVHYTYDGMNKVEESDRRGNITKYTYNGRNLLTEIEWPSTEENPEVITKYAYDEVGNKTDEWDPNNICTHYTYDGLNRLKSKTQDSGGLNLTTWYTYDPVGNRTGIKDAEQNSTVYHYDALNRLDWVRDALQGYTRYGYDTLGNKIWTEDARGHRTRYYYDTLNRLWKVVGPLAVPPTTYGYDEVGNRIEQVDGKGQHIEYEYDDLSRLTTREFVGTNPLVSISYGYDPNGNRTSMTDSREWMEDVEYVPDVLNRITDVIYSDEKQIQYVYDPNGNREEMKLSGDGGQDMVTEYNYDELNRLDYVIAPGDNYGTRTDYTYDAGSRLTDMTYPNSTTTHYDYDGANRITAMETKNSSGTRLQLISYPEYDRVGNKKQMENAAGTATYGYDHLYRLTSVAHGSTTESYTYDETGNRLTKSVNGDIEERYGYNDANQLVTRQVGGAGTPTKEITVTGTVSDPVTVGVNGVSEVKVNGVAAELHEEQGGYGFSAAGVVLHPGTNTLTAMAKDYAGNTSEQSVTVTYAMQASYNYSYDNNGNLETMVKTGQSTETTAYEYDYENRMTKVTLPGSTGTNIFTYDGDKRRVSATNTAGTVTKFLYDGVNNLKDYAANGTALASYVQGIGIDKLISRTDANGTRYYHADALGSTRMMTRPDQTSAATYTYDAWGKVTSPPNQNDGNRHKFTAREFEDEIGLQYNRARFYDPATGRFITQDPLTKGPDDPTICYKNNIYSAVDRAVKEYVNAFEPHRILNRYAYCVNNPINFIDPLGLEALWYEALSEWAHDNLEASQEAVTQNIPTNDVVAERIGEAIATAVITAMELGTGLLDTPKAVGDLGQGIGKFSADPTLENAAGLAQDISVAAGVVAAGLSSLPSTRSVTVRHNTTPETAQKIMGSDKPTIEPSRDGYVYVEKAKPAAKSGVVRGDPEAKQVELGLSSVEKAKAGIDFTAKRSELTTRPNPKTGGKDIAIKGSVNLAQPGRNPQKFIRQPNPSSNLSQPNPSQTNRNPTVYKDPSEPPE